MKYKGIIICDLDGTIIDSRKDLTTGVNLMRADYNLQPLSFETVTSYVGNGARKLAERSLQGFNADIDEALTKMKHYYSIHIADETSVYPSVEEGLQIIKYKNYALAIVTNKQNDAANEIIQSLNLMQYFDIVLGVTAKLAIKPAPDMLEFAMKETDTTSNNSWIIGDNYTDIESGKNANLKICFAEYGFGDHRNLSFDLKVKSFAEFANSL